jgi:NAD(P)H-nitrite reductase large subunit
MIDDDVLVCRCEEVTAKEIREAIKLGADSLTAIKRMTRAGMGLCQGRTCQRLVAQILSQETGKRMDEILPDSTRPPVRPVTFGEMCGENDD